MDTVEREGRREGEGTRDADVCVLPEGKSERVGMGDCVGPTFVGEFDEKREAVGSEESEEREEALEDMDAAIVRVPENEDTGESEGGGSLVRDTVEEIEARLAVKREEEESEGEGVPESVI